MSTPEQPASPPLTRKQLREIRNTGSNPVITATAESDAPPQDTDAPATIAPAAAPPGVASPAPFPRPADPAVVSPPPVADAAVDLGVSPLTRRQARQQERIRTASVPVVTPEVIAAHAAAGAGSASAFAMPPAVVDPPVAAPSFFTEPEPEHREGDPSTDSGVHALFGLPRTEERSPEPQTAPENAPAAVDDSSPEAQAARDAAADGAKAIVNPLLGASLLSGTPEPAEPARDFPPSFDQLLTRATGTHTVQNTLIMSQAPEVGPFVGPVTATGEVIITGTYNLPEGLGSTGHAKGTADGKEIDATLVDGELPSHSSPTPIAASAAVSTVKMPGEVIKPPAPEKGSRLMMTLAITAGALALALVGVLILAFATGVFS